MIIIMVMTTEGCTMHKIAWKADSGSSFPIRVTNRKKSSVQECVENGGTSMVLLGPWRRLAVVVAIVNIVVVVVVVVVLSSRQFDHSTLAICAAMRSMSRRPWDVSFRPPFESFSTKLISSKDWKSFRIWLRWGAELVPYIRDSS